MIFLEDVADLGGPTMAGRRVATITHWLVETGLVKQIGIRYLIDKLPADVPFVDYTNAVAEPLLPVKYGLSDYQQHEETFKQRLGTTTVLVDQAKMERANKSHNELIKLVATRLKAVGSVPKVGKLIDLAATVSGAGQFIFEMKSTTPDNARSQIRHGISQLYEYRYIEQAKDAHLVLVLEKAFETPDAWMRDYLTEDRNVLVLWDGDGNLYCPTKTAPKLAFLQPIAV